MVTRILIAFASGKLFTNHLGTVFANSVPWICILRKLYYWMAILQAAQTQTAFESIVHGSLLPAAFAKPSAKRYHETH
jgi:hypothetical protein